MSFKKSMFLVFCSMTLIVFGMLTGCAHLDNTATITKTETGVTFDTTQPCDTSMKEGETEYKYSGKSESLISKIVSILTLGALRER